MKLLDVGDKAPDFSLKDKDGKVHSLAGIESKYVVVYFYPKDDTPVCTIEANEFNQNLSEFKKLDTTIIGISGGDEKSKTKFCKEHDLNLLLLSDPDFSVCTKYGVYGEKNFMGRIFMGINRITYILDKNNKVLKVYEKVNPKGHAEEIIELIKTL